MVMYLFPGDITCSLKCAIYHAFFTFFFLEEIRNTFACLKHLATMIYLLELSFFSPTQKEVTYVSAKKHNDNHRVNKTSSMECRINYLLLLNSSLLPFLTCWQNVGWEGEENQKGIKRWKSKYYNCQWQK